ncbi:MAG: hypothetical protein N4A50_07415, partial [Vallitalea sp.]|nr:hypothetical protein [Vallitalea sp.]
TGDEKYPDWIQEKIRQATDDYYNATDQGGRDDAHDAALKLRKLGETALKTNTEENKKITNNSSFHQEAKKKISNNQYFSKESWEETISLSTSNESDINNSTNISSGIYASNNGISTGSKNTKKETNNVEGEKDINSKVDIVKMDENSNKINVNYKPSVSLTGNNCISVNQSIDYAKKVPPAESRL